MGINFDVLIDSEELSVDMKSGLDTLQGVSDAVRNIAETVLEGKMPKHLMAKSDVRTNMKKNFRGSYGQNFSLDVYEEERQKKLKKIGHQTLVELIGYFISEATYQDHDEISPKAKAVLKELDDECEKLIKKLRKSSLQGAHATAEKFGQNVRIRYKKSRDNITEVARFDANTGRGLDAKITNEKLDLVVSITRFNIYTGNGRMIIKGEDETVPFGFRLSYREVQIKAKKLFSENLNHNNGIDRDHWQYLTISANPIRRQDGTVVKYIVKAFDEN